MNTSSTTMTTDLTTLAGDLRDSAYEANTRLTMAEAAAACGVSKDTIKRRRQAKRFPNSRQHGLDRHWLIPVQDLVAAGLLERERVTHALGKMEEVRDRKESAEVRVQIVELVAENKGLHLQLEQALNEVEFLRKLVVSGRAA